MTEYAYLGEHTGICRILGRFHCYVDTRDRKICSHLLTKGVWEIQNTECMARLIKPGMTVIDVGANFGYFTLLMCGLIGNQGGKVYTIEANPELCELIQDSLEVNGMLSKTDLINCAVYKAQVKELEFTFGNNKTMNGRLGDFKKNSTVIRKDEKVIKVAGNTLDNLIPDNQQIDFIKVDIEGAEEMFWYGSKRIRDSNNQLKTLMEYNPRSYSDPVKLINHIFDQGYEVKRINKTPEKDCICDRDMLLNLSKNEHVMLLLSKP